MAGRTSGCAMLSGMATSGLITAADGWSYQLTASDLDWLSREIANEGGNDAATLWTMAQRLYMLRAHFSSMTSMIRAFSQPINPRWLAGGDLCAAHPTQCTVDEQQKRAHAQDPNTVYPRSLAFVQSWAAGQIPNPVPRAVDFRRAMPPQISMVASGAVTPDPAPATATWRATARRTGPRTSFSLPGWEAAGGGGIAGAVALAVVAWGLWKWLALAALVVLATSLGGCATTAAYRDYAIVATIAQVADDSAELAVSEVQSGCTDDACRRDANLGARGDRRGEGCAGVARSGCAGRAAHAGGEAVAVLNALAHSVGSWVTAWNAIAAALAPLGITLPQLLA